MGLENGVELKQKVHHFHLNTPQGVQELRVPHSQMKRCQCGCERFNKQYHVTWVKPLNVIAAPPLCLNVEIYVCADCDLVLTIDNPNIG